MNDLWWTVVIVVLCSNYRCVTAEAIGYDQIDKYKCGTFEPPIITKPAEKCFDSDATTGTFSNEEREWYLFYANLMRGHVANKCDKFEIAKSATNMPRYEWNCNLEEKLKFDCSNIRLSKDKLTFSSDNDLESDSLNIAHAPLIWTYFENNPLDMDQSSLTNLVLDTNAIEFACYRQICRDDNKFNEVIACANGLNLGKEGLPYTPGEKCKQDSDCTIGPHLKCDKPFGLCQTTESCRIPYLDKLYKHCSEYNVRLSYVVIASKLQKNLFDFKGIATIVGKRHLLTSISHFATELHDNEMLLLVQNSFEAFINKKLKPSFYVSVYNTNNWSDFVLITLDENSNYVFPNDLINQVTTQLDGKKTTVTNDLSTKEIKFQSVEHCEEAFSVDHIRYDKNTMYCAEDDTESPGDFLNGSPIYVKTATGTKLMGIRSVNSLHSKFKRTYMIQRLDKHCDWLAKASYGHVKCTND